MEAHGRVGLYKCLPTVEQEAADDEIEEQLDDATSDEEKAAKLAERAEQRKTWCEYAHSNNVKPHEIMPESVRSVMQPLTEDTKDDVKDDVKDDTKDSNSWEEVEAPELPSAPTCPGCESALLPQALMFDESYSSHDFYEYEKFRDWFDKADAFVFVGTSFAVTVTDMAINEAKKRFIPVYNFNLEAGRINPSATLNAENVIGKSEETLEELWHCLRDKLVGEEGAKAVVKSEPT